MKKPSAILFLLAGCLSLMVSGYCVHSVSAHQAITVGDYQVEIGWLDEPPVVGQRNAIVVNLRLTSAGEKVETIDISKLALNIVYGGETRPLNLQPLSEDSQNQYAAPLLPTRPGKYTVAISGSIGTTAVNAAVQPEEVETADSLQFPLAANPAEQAGGLSLPVILSVVALLAGLVALGISAFSLRKIRQ